MQWRGFNVGTKEKILSEALNLFSVKGYEPVSVRDIAYAVGIKESSLYNHFTNKLDIFDSIINEYSKRTELFFNQLQLTGEDQQFRVDERTVEMYKNMTQQQFLAISSIIFDFYFADEINVKLRKMLTIEQYRSPEITKLFRELSFEGSLNFQASLFAALIQAGCFIDTDPYMMALAFFSPIFLIFYKFDNDIESLNAAKDLFEKHVMHFHEVYSK